MQLNSHVCVRGVCVCVCVMVCVCVISKVTDFYTSWSRVKTSFCITDKKEGRKQGIKCEVLYY